MRNRKSASANKAALLLCAASFALGIDPAHAQNAPSNGPQALNDQSVETVTVTARRRSELLGNVPIAESAITAESLYDRGLISDMGALLADAPGVHFQNQGATRIDDISIRGSGTGGTNADGAVGLYRDGEYAGAGWVFDRNFAYIDTFDLQQVEVLRGPQGGLYGRNSEGGVILAETMKPQFENSGHVFVDYGINNIAPDVQGVLNEQLSDTVAIRLSGEAVYDFGGYFKDVTYNKYLEEDQGLMARGQIRYASGPLDVTVMFEHQTLHGPGGNDQMRFAPGSPGYPGGYIAPVFTNYLYTFPIETTQINNGIVTATYKFDFATLTSVTGARFRRDFDVTDTDQLGLQQYLALKAQTPPEATTITLASIYNYVVQNSYNGTLNENLYLAGDKIDGFTWLAGVELLDDDADTFQDIRSTATGQTAPSNGAITAYHYIMESYSPYADLSYDILSNLTIEGSVRYELDHKQLVANKFTETAMTPVLYESPKLNDNFTSYNVTLSYHPTSDIMLYAKTSTGYRAGGFNPPSLSANPATDPVQVQLTYGDESTTSYELGAKGSLVSWLDPGADWLTGDIALYRNEFHHLLTLINNGCSTSNVCHAPADSFLITGGDGNGWGLELSIDAHFPLFGGETHLSASGADQQGEFTSGHTSTASLTGRAIPQEPRWNTALNVNYVHPITDAADVFLNVNFSGQWGGVSDVSTFLPLPDHQTTDIRLGTDIGDWQAAVYCKNCGDEVYVQYIANLNNYRWSEPRIYGLEARYRW